MAADMMHHKGYQVRYPAIETNLDGIQRRVEFYEPDETLHGQVVDGAYLKDGLKQDALEKFDVEVTDYRTGDIKIWAHNDEEARDIACGLTTDEINTYVACHKAGLKAVTAKQRLVTLVLKDQDGMDMRLYSVTIRTTLPDEEIIPAIMAASQDYLNTPEGRKTWEDNCHCFNFGDFDLNVTNKFCLPHGFYRVENEPVVIEDDYNTQLASLED